MFKTVDRSLKVRNGRLGASVVLLCYRFVTLCYGKGAELKDSVMLRYVAGRGTLRHVSCNHGSHALRSALAWTLPLTPMGPQVAPHVVLITS